MSKVPAGHENAVRAEESEKIVEGNTINSTSHASVNQRRISMRYLVTSHSFASIKRSIPSSWEAEYLHPKFINRQLDVTSNEYYAGNDDGYNTLCKYVDANEDNSFCVALADLANNKYKARSLLKSLKGVPFTICTNNRVEWPYDVNDDLIAKPIHGTGSRNVIKTKHGESLPNIDEDYIIEKYIDDRYQRVSVDGYVCGDKIGFLSTCDNMYYSDDPTKFHYLGHPSIHHDDPKLKQRFVDVIRELVMVTGCNNQIIDVEFFAVEGDFLVMEINPRILANSVPIYSKIAGINPWIFSEGLKNGVVYDLTDTPQIGVIRYNYRYRPGEACEIEHDENTFSLIGDGVSENFSLTYRTTTNEIPHSELIKSLDLEYPPDTLF